LNQNTPCQIKLKEILCSTPNIFIIYSAGKEFKVGSNKQNIIGLNVRTMLRGGYRTVPVDFAASKLKMKKFATIPRHLKPKP